MRTFKILLIVTILLAGNEFCFGADKKFTSPFIKTENNQRNVNDLEPDYFYKPLIYIVITNPDTKKSEIVSALIDTGADRCFMNKELFNHLGLAKLDKPPNKVYTGSDPIKTYAVEVEYQLANSKKELVEDFPMQKTHFYVNENISQHDVILGFIGFIDRFNEIQFIYPDKMVFHWE